MKLRIFGILGLFAVLLTLMAIVTACTNSNPASPTQPTPAAATSTPCGFPGMTCTATPTTTATGTFTACPNTPVPTATPNSGNQLTGSVTCSSGGVTVTGSTPLMVALYTDSGLTNLAALGPVATNGGTYTLNVSASGTYYLAAFYDAAGIQGLTNMGEPAVGDFYTIYSGSPNSCSAPATQGVAITGATAGPAVSFGNSCTLLGLSGSVTYAGSKGLVSNCSRIYLVAYNTSFTAATGDFTFVSSNGTRYDLATVVGGASTFSVQAFYDLYGTGFIAHGDPVTNLSGPYNAMSVNGPLPVTITDAYIY